MLFGGIQKTSLIDFPDRIATVLFVRGCNLRCPFCYNWRLVTEQASSTLSGEDVLNILERRKRFVKAVVLTGGEPTIQEDILDFVKKLKQRGFEVKLDTNGFFPDVLMKCLPYLDYVALDVKTSPEKYNLLGECNIKEWKRTIELLKNGKVDYEFRNTAVPGLMDDQSVRKIGKLVKGAKRFIFQSFVPGDTLDSGFCNLKPFTIETMNRFVEIMKNYVKDTKIR
jgi:pyruvate formate lyase activating enzyme